MQKLIRQNVQKLLPELSNIKIKYLSKEAFTVSIISRGATWVSGYGAGILTEYPAFKSRECRGLSPYSLPPFNTASVGLIIKVD